MPALFHGVIQRAISAGSEQVAERGDNTEQRGEGKQPQKHLFTQVLQLLTEEERHPRAQIDQNGTVWHYKIVVAEHHGCQYTRLLTLSLETLPS